MKFSIRYIQVNLQHAKAATYVLSRIFKEEQLNIAFLQEPWTSNTDRVNELGNISDSSVDANIYPPSIAVPFTIVYVIIFFTGVIGNVSTCVVIAKNKSMHTATNYYLFSLAVSDMLLLISALPPEMYRIWSPDKYIFGEAFCVLQGFAAETSANASILIITSFTVERYVAICHPFLSHTMSKLSRAIRYIIAIWIIALILAIPQASQFGVKTEMKNGETQSHCTIVTTFVEHAFEISTLVFFVCPMTLITILYVLIWIRLRKSKKITTHRVSTLSNATTESGRKKMMRNAYAQNRVVKMLILNFTLSRKVYDRGWEAQNEQQLRRRIFEKLRETDLNSVQGLMRDIRRNLRLVEEYGPLHIM
ncbi:hypothetical protein NQ315_002935 [Exocentrus adspersus]|uniref:G-protein coupled receptors family 1 profile domain-containing protein n=1 Tax=Exocentrus adspersus TaxID=1586481 RepID=A0AAV8W5D0_9CUCU|nr:hypothetical protein NQ315_002935 [Exocentrus adspersus]